MMYIKLCKVFFKENFSLKRLLGSSTTQSKGKTILLGILILYGLGTILFSFGYLFLELGRVFKGMDSLDALLTYIFMYATFLSAFFIILRAGSYLFNYKDYDFLASLPLKNEVVLSAKISVMMVMVYLSVFIVSAPIVFSYFYHSGFHFGQLLVIIISLFFIPILPLIVFSFFSLAITYVLTKLGINKIFSIILTFGLLLAYMYFAFSFNAQAENPFLNQSGFLDSVSQYIPTARLFQSAVADLDLLALLLFMLVNSAALLIFIYAVKELIHKTNQNQTKSIRRRRRLTKFKHRSLMETLVIKEIKKFFSVNIYIMNTGFGPLLMIIGGVLSFVYASRLESFVGQMIGMDLQIEYAILLLTGFFLSTVYTSAISLSLEGNNFWLIRSLPIKANQIMIGKMLFNVLVGLPFALFFVASIGFSLSLNILNILVMLVLVASFSFASSILGSIINLYFPKFDYKNETEVVKQSVGAFLGMFSGFGILLIMGLLSHFLLASLDIKVTFLILAFINVIIFIGGLQFLKQKAESLFMKFS